jgi:hypothetical protein
MAPEANTARRSRAREFSSLVGGCGPARYRREAPMRLVVGVIPWGW